MILPEVLPESVEQEKKFCKPVGMWLESSSLGAQVLLNSRVEMLNSLKFDGDVC